MYNKLELDMSQNNASEIYNIDNKKEEVNYLLLYNIYIWFEFMSISYPDTHCELPIV